MKFLFAAVLATLVLGTSLASATPPSNLSLVILSRTTLTGPLEIRVPQLVVVSTKVKVRTSSGKFVTRIKKVKKILMRPVQACSATATCDLIVLAATFQPGGTEGWHSHPGVVMIGVKSGALTTYDMNCSKQTVSPGQSFVMMGSNHTLLVRNDGPAVAESIVTLILPAGLPAIRTDQPAPAGCSAVG